MVPPLKYRGSGLASLRLAGLFYGLSGITWGLAMIADEVPSSEKAIDAS
jgi:hypothetical protein